MYRDLKLRGALISDKELKLLPQEQIHSQVEFDRSCHTITHGPAKVLFVTHSCHREEALPDVMPMQNNLVVMHTTLHVVSAEYPC